MARKPKGLNLVILITFVKASHRSFLNMKVFYHSGDAWRRTPPKLEAEQNMLSLSFNNWDDYGISTTLNAVLYLDGRSFLNFSLKLLIEGDIYSPKKLNELCEKGWDGFFPVPEINYVSVPSDIDFYPALLGKLDEEEVLEVLRIIRDAGYLKNVEKDQDAIRLTEEDSFKTSLLREGGARKSFLDGWTLFVQQVSKIDDFVLYARKYNGSSESINFKFNSENLPYDINVLIGPNGIGKSYTLKSLVEYWLGVESGNKNLLEEQGHVPFDNAPNISKLILISYSPFEEFTIDLTKADLLDKEAYKYFGFRQVKEADDGEQRIGISRNLPASDSVNSILKAFADDYKFSFMPTWKGKVETIWSVLQPAIGFDVLAVEIKKEIELRVAVPEFPNYIFDANGKTYLPLDDNVYRTIVDWGIDITESVNFQAGVIFLKDGKKVGISSGQRLFSYIVLNVVGQIRSDSLIVIDEPELFLHPTLEITFISLLKKVLKAFNSKAILATHSLAIAREVPSNCTHVYREYNGEMEVQQPPFETLGGDMQRISSYVFGDNSISKPFDEWIDEKIIEYGNPQALIQQLGKELNEELLIKILNSGAKDGH